jgi:ribosome-binding protein aMBF1 (putative translation factor)
MTVIDAAQWPSRDNHGGPGIPSSFQTHRLRELCTQAGWSQAELADKINSDARQVSRYESGKVAPDLEAVVRIAEVLNVAVDYLVIPDTPRRPLHAPTTPSTTNSPPSPPSTPTTRPHS